ncbi:hypothetical protein [Actinomadura sp. DC4]|uniref:hypothetical protein n=1 Tax=Actinomadura sp. DC4 TaxID=3055069 RepID=UPI0025B13F3A|nr:hypothetical protein [Actinomadura sp. DC4]MDN3354923.1 hypothetical protein [Actinomadura sp. DC4]
MSGARTVLPVPIVRASVDLGLGSGIAAAYGMWRLSSPESRASWQAPAGVAFIGSGLTALIIGAVGAVLVLAAAATAEKSVWWRSGAVVGVIVLLFGLFVPGSSAIGALFARYVLPVVSVLLFGLWLCLLTRSRGEIVRWPRYAADLLVVGVVAAALVVVFRTERLAAAGLLFPPGVAPVLRLWRAMGRSTRLTVRAGADVVFSVLLGTGLLLLFVWAADLFHLSPREVSALRGVLAAVGSASGFPWWSWAALYALLAVAGVALAVWPVRPARLGRVAHRLRVVPVVGAARRLLTVAHLALLIAVLIGLAAPAALRATIEGRTRSEYTVALRNELEAAGERAAYERIHDLPPPRSSIRPLADMLTKIHTVGPPPRGSDDATETERHLAARLGGLQARTQSFGDARGWRASRPADHILFGFSRETGLRRRLRGLATMRQNAERAGHRASRAGELAAVAVANLLQAPDLGRTEVVQLLTEYLGGLVENGPIKDFFTSWAERAAGEPPATERLVVPNPQGLELAASLTLNEERRKQLLPITSPPEESPIDASVDLANQARYLQEGTGPCAGCQRPVRPRDDPHEVPPEHPIIRP